MADEPNLVEMITALGEALRADLAAHCATMDAKHQALSDSVAKMKKGDVEAEGVRHAGIRRVDAEDDDLARQTAADSVSRAEMRVMQDQVNSLIRAQPAKRTQADMNAYADAQSKFDVAYVTLGARADSPMQGEDIVAYNIRLARGLQKYSPTWSKAELVQIARDDSTFRIALDGIRADAVAYGLNPPDLKPFEHRMITENSNGHTIRRFVGNGTIFKQMSRPPRHVLSIGADDRYPRSAGGSVFAAK